jgi:pyruvate,orthophosphate dikinase
MPTQWVYRLDELDRAEKDVGGLWSDVKSLLGGKGANLTAMTRLGVSVPPGFIVSTEACNAYFSAGGAFPPDLWPQVLKAVTELEKLTGKGFGRRQSPLLVSCRSGAKFSMPGMMDTVLNIGLNDETAAGLIEMSGDERFVYDCYRRLVQMFGAVVMGIPDEAFEEKLRARRVETGAAVDADFKVADLERLTQEFKQIYRNHTGLAFPNDPKVQLKSAVEAVFKSWNGKRAVDYRNATGIAHDLGTAVNIVAMVFGNLGEQCLTGVALTRDGTTGENRLEGDYLLNAQGEDVVAGIRQPLPLFRLKEDMPGIYAEIEQIAKKLEAHYQDMQDIEFTVEKGKLWILQTRDAKRTAQAAVRVAVEMAEDGLISHQQAVLRITPEQVDFFLHPQFERQAASAAQTRGELLASGLNVSPGAAVGMVAFDADLAESWAHVDKKQVIMVRPETKPDDIHGMLAAEGILTSRGGRTSHAALVARQFGKPAVVGVSELQIDLINRCMSINGEVVKEGDWLSIDGTSGMVFKGRLQTIVPDTMDPFLKKLLAWADTFRRLQVRCNADNPADAERARRYGAEGIGLCRTEHMFFESRRLPYLHKMIMTDLPIERREALDALLPFQREDFIGLFHAMEGLPVIARLIDPPLHEFLPNHAELSRDLADLKIRLKHADTLEKIDALVQQINEKTKILKRIERLQENNPMLGLRGVRLGIHIPELTTMQVRAIFEAACMVTKEGGSVHPEIMIPLTSHVNELHCQREILEKEAKKVMAEQGINVDYKFGTMIEVPRAALTAEELAEYAEFFSFGTNDLTQTTFGMSRDDAEARFLIGYMHAGILSENPFATIDRQGVGQLMAMAVKKARAVKPDLECGICGEHAGDPESIFFCHEIGLTYVSCSSYRVPIARLSSAQAALRAGTSQDSNAKSLAPADRVASFPL